MRRKPHFGLAAFAAAGLSVSPAIAGAGDIAIPVSFAKIAPPAATVGVPPQLAEADRVAYRGAFAALRARNWAQVDTIIGARPEGVLTPIVRAELYLAKGSPAVGLDPLLAAIASAPQLPQATDLARLARARGALSLPVTLPIPADLSRLPGAPRRGRATPGGADAVASRLAATLAPLIKEDRAADAELALLACQADLGGDARVEWQQRVAWMHYLAGNDAAALRLATQARAGSGEWAVQADWTAGLAAWRLKDYDAAATAFAAVAARGRDSETIAAGLYWAARADTARGRPEAVQARLRTAARLPETFYGLLAGAALGTATPARAPATFVAADWSTLSARPNIRVAAALTEIGERDRAEALLRHQARIGSPTDHAALVHLAGRLELPATQIWLAQNGPRGAQLSADTRYPVPAWKPAGGWRVDKSLVLAHALQESQFRPDAISPAGARGLMQLMPGTVALVAKEKGVAIPASVTAPETNMEFGQSYLERLRDMGLTGGLLPKVIAAYNAGPGAIPKWNVRDGGDPLLFIESIPYIETRGYVAIVMRNYWMYQRQAGEVSASLTELAQGQWPRFPARTVIRAAPIGATASAD